MNREFEAKKAVRERVPMLVGLFGPSGSGKTYSALRLASGMRDKTGGEIFVIDTEARRALHYADEFEFQHIDMMAPFSPLDYMEAIEYCANQKAGVLVVDSMSHEHEGPGGVLEMHEAELDRMAGNDWRKRERVKFAAWIKPKAARRKLINAVTTLGINAVFCFRAKEKMKITKGEDPKGLGWMPIAGEEFLFEMTINCLLYPGSGGVPTWDTSEIGERIMLKLPENLRGVFKPGDPLSEDAGKRLAEWASGRVVKGSSRKAETPRNDVDQPSSRVDRLIEQFRESQSLDELEPKIIAAREEEWSEDEKKQIRAAIVAVKGRMK